MAMTSDETWWLLQIYSHYSRGFLPLEGGIFNQPAWLMSRLNAVAAIRAEVLEYMEKQKKRNGGQ